MSKAEARAIIAEVWLSPTREHQSGGVYECFFSERGATYVRLSDQLIRTSFDAVSFDPRSRALVREMIRLGI